jgi:hypothetical protein
LDANDRTASDSFDRIDTTHLLVVALAYPCLPVQIPRP